MGLGGFFKDDIKNILVALYQTTLQSGVGGDYRRGYEAALVSTALAFGITLTILNAQQQLQSYQGGHYDNS